MADKRVFPGSQTDGSLTLTPLPSRFAWGEEMRQGPWRRRRRGRRVPGIPGFRNIGVMLGPENDGAFNYAGAPAQKIHLGDIS